MASTIYPHDRRLFREENWPESRWPSFSFKEEIACKETGTCYIDPDFMDSLQAMRNAIGKPLIITSGYRSPKHSIEAAKNRPGAHPTGKAVDIKCSGPWAHEVLRCLMAYGFTGIGVQQDGPHGDRFLHADRITAEEGFHAPRASLWSYSNV